MIALTIVADGDQQHFIDTLADLMTLGIMGELAPKRIVDASGSDDHRGWLISHYGRMFDIVDIADASPRPETIELRIPAGALLENEPIGLGFR